MYKIYSKGNYFVIHNIIKNEFFYGLSKEVFIDKSNINNSTYKIHNVKDWSEKTSLKITQILQEDGSPYIEEDFETFYLNNTGNFNSGSALDPQILEALNNSDSPSSINPFATINDIGVKSLDSVSINTDGTLKIEFTDAQNNVNSVTTTKSVLSIRYNVLNYSALSSISPSPALYDYAYVREPQGTAWLPGILGGTYYGAGLYTFNGTNWVESNIDLYQEIDSIISNKADLNHSHVIEDITDLSETLNDLSSTTLLELNGEIEINLDNSKFNFPSGSGVIVDNSVYPPLKTLVSWNSLTAETTPFLLTSTNTFLAVDVNGDLIKTQDLQSVDQTSDYIIVGWVEHTTGVIERTGTEPYYNLNLGQQFQQLLETLGAFNVEGNELSANGANKKLNISAGIVVDNGLGYSQNIKSPNHYISNAIEEVQFRYFYRDGLGGWVNNAPLTTELDVHNYDNGSGTLQTIPSGKWLLKRVFYYAPFGYLDIYHSQNYYNSAEEALDAYSRGGFEDNDYISFDIPVAIIVVKHGTSDLSNTNDCIIRKASSTKLGGSGVSSGEVNTASNVGTAGIGVFKQKTGVDLEFKKLNPGSNKITVTDDTSNSKIDINVNEANFSNIPQSAVTNLVSNLSNKYDISNPAGYISTETDPVVRAVNGIVKSNGTTITNAVAGTDYALPNANTTGTASNITATSNSTLISLPNLSLLGSQVSGDISGNSSGFSGSLSGEVTGTQTTTSLSNSAVINKVLTGYTSGAGTLTSTDSILQAIQKLNGNDALKVTANTAITGATNTKITYDSKGLVTSGTTLSASDIPNIAQSQVTNLVSDLAGKQATLTSGTNIKTVNGNSLLGSGNLVVNEVTNLTVSQSASNVIINSDTGTDATIPLGNGTNAGVSLNDFTTAEKNKLAGIATGATVNSSDTTLLNRTNHTGTQTASTISDFNTTVDTRINSTSINALQDVVLTSPITGQVLKYDGTNWINGTDNTSVGGSGLTYGQVRRLNTIL